MNLTEQADFSTGLKVRIKFLRIKPFGLINSVFIAGF